MTAAPAGRSEPAVVDLRRPAPGRVVRPRVPDGGGAGRRRRDIEGLRAVAVVLVVLSHAGVSRLAGGYVGVDVFFVISGFLITSLLVREATSTGTVSLGRFWARRAVRLLPASSFVLAVTLVGSWLWLSPVRVPGYAVDGLAGAFYATNIRLAIAQTDYFAGTAPSPFQHFWSLAVEEQFYLLWPLLVIATWLVWRRRPARLRRRALAVVLSVLTVVSFAVSVLEIRRAAPWAYFGLHSRAWELGVGALVALAAPRLARLPARVATLLGGTGLLAVLTAALSYHDTTPFPGAAATLPVAGAALVVAAGCGHPDAAAGRLLAVPPMQVVGRWSYGWYLWHWPMLLIAPAALQVVPGTALNLALCAGSLALAGVTYHLLENPVRHRRALIERPARGVGLGLGLSACTAALAMSVAWWPPAVGGGAAAVDTRAAVARAADPKGALTALITAADGVTAAPRNLTPALADAPAEVSGPQRDGCHLALTSRESTAPCVYGRAGSATTVVLFGDSHALQWFPAMRELAEQRGWRLVSLTRSACSPADIAVSNGVLKRPYTECAGWRAAALRRIRRESPALVVVASSTNYRGSLVGHPADPDAVWRDGWGRTLSALRASAARVTLLADTPFLADDPVDCLAARGATVRGCAPAAAAVLRDPGWRAAARRAAVASGATVVDPVGWLCAQRCPPVVGNVLVYRDSNHLSAAYAVLLAPLLGAALPLG